MNLCFESMVVKFKNDFIFSELQSHSFDVLIRRVHWLNVAMMVQSEFWIWNHTSIDTDIDSFCFTKDSIWSKTCQKWSTFVFSTFVFDDYDIGCTWHQGLCFKGWSKNLCWFRTCLEKEHLWVNSYGCFIKLFWKIILLRPYSKSILLISIFPSLFHPLLRK